MKLSKNEIEGFKKVLKREGLKFTNQRLLIFKTLYESQGHFDCEEIIKMIPEKYGKISRATAYRTLDILVKNNFVSKLVLDDGVARYENKKYIKHHDHMICIETGEIIEFYNDEIETLQEEIAASKGYEIVKHIHQLFVKKIK